MNLYIDKLEISLKGFRLHGEHLDFHAGDICLLSAPNGSGKSVFLKGIAGLIKTNQRIIKINNEDINKLNLSVIMAAYLGEEFLIPFYEPVEYFQLIGKIKGLENEQIKAAIESISCLFRQKWPEKYIRELSTGMRKKVGLAGSLIGNPQIILWDEPFENVDSKARDLLMEFIKNEKRLVIYSSPVGHNLPFLCKLVIRSERILLEQKNA